MLKALVLLPILITSLTQNPRIGVQNPNFTEKNHQNVQLKVPFVHQVEDLEEELKPLIRTSACGPASIAMILKFYNQQIGLPEVIAKLPTDVYIKGVGFYDLPKAANEFEMQSVSIKPTIKEIYQTLYNGNPVILNVQNYDGITGHAVVITGIRDFDGVSARSLVVNDPYRNKDIEFSIIDEKTLLQPEGYRLSVGIIDPFYMIPAGI